MVPEEPLPVPRVGVINNSLPQPVNLFMGLVKRVIVVRSIITTHPPQ